MEIVHIVLGSALWVCIAGTTFEGPHEYPTYACEGPYVWLAPAAAAREDMEAP